MISPYPCAHPRSTPRTSSCAMPARCRSSPIRTRASRCRASGSARRGAWRAQTLAEIVEPRYEELFNLVRDELRRSGFEEIIAAGVVLTGGSARMEGAIELAEEIFHVPVRLGSAGPGSRPRRCGEESHLFDGRGAAAVRARKHRWRLTCLGTLRQRGRRVRAAFAAGSKVTFNNG